MTVKYEILVILLHYWKRKMCAAEATKLIAEIEGPDQIKHSTARRWFAKFNSSDTSLKRKTGSGRSATLEDDALQSYVESDPSLSTRQLADSLSSSKSTIHRHLRAMGKKYRAPQIDPYELTEAQASKRLQVCQQLLNNPLDDRFFKTIVAMDEKWILLNNPNKKWQWLSPNESALSYPKLRRFDKKVMISVFWNCDGMLFFELLPDGQSITSDTYSSQLKHLHDVMKVKYPHLINRKRVLLQADNAKPHTSRKSMETLKEIDGIELLPHPPYSPDVAASDFHLFRSMAHFLKGRRFENKEDLQKNLQLFFDSKPSDWYKSGIQKIAERWALVCENDGYYFSN